MTIQLGKLATFDLREVWPDEAADFTPWLAEEENLELLGAELGLDLELVGTQVQVGPYWADVMATDTASERTVIIENQLEKTNHDHLGKSLTYGAILDAAVVVWIAKEFTDEHRKTLDWLNDHTDENLRFFGVCIELWKVGDSLPAPRFNVVSRPSGLLKVVGTGEELTETRKLQLEFWTALSKQLADAKAVPSLQTPRPQYWYNIALGRSGFHLSCIANTSENRIGVRLYLRQQVAQAALEQLEPQKAAIHEEMGMELNWNPFPDKQDKIVLADRTANLAEKDKWPEYLDWLTKTVAAFSKAFRNRVKAIELGASPSEEDSDLPSEDDG